MAQRLMQVTTMQKDEVLKLHEQLSAMADGELDGDDVAQLMGAPIGNDGDLHATWHAYHLIGDVLRGGEQAVAQTSAGFLSRLQGRLALEEPLALAMPVRPSEPVRPLPSRAEPANDASFRWKMVAGCASFAAVAAFAWGVVGGASAPLSQPQLALVPAPVMQASAPEPVLSALPQTVEQPVTLASGEAQVMIRDARLDELLAAHKQVGGSTALQMPAPAGFLRSATFSAPER